MNQESREQGAQGDAKSGASSPVGIPTGKRGGPEDNKGRSIREWRAGQGSV